MKIPIRELEISYAQSVDGNEFVAEPCVTFSRWVNHYGTHGDLQIGVYFPTPSSLGRAWLMQTKLLTQWMDSQKAK